MIVRGKFSSIEQLMYNVIKSGELPLKIARVTLKKDINLMKEAKKYGVTISTPISDLTSGEINCQTQEQTRDCRKGEVAQPDARAEACLGCCYLTSGEINCRTEEQARDCQGGKEAHPDAGTEACLGSCDLTSGEINYGPEEQGRDCQDQYLSVHLKNRRGEVNVMQEISPPIEPTDLFEHYEKLLSSKDDALIDDMDIEVFDIFEGAEEHSSQIYAETMENMNFGNAGVDDLQILDGMGYQRISSSSSFAESSD